jgi:murein DD-endopeptidase MepM/ murein hydrolase activator NlpD
MSMEKKKKGIWKKIRSRYQFSIMNEENYEVKSVHSLSVLNILLWVFSIVLVIGSMAFALIAFTPVRQYIPGYGKIDERRAAIRHQALADSISIWAEQVDQKMNIISKVLSGDIDTGIPSEDLFTNNYDSIAIFGSSREDSMLRAEVEQRERFSIFEDEEGEEESLLSLTIFPPIRGVFSDTFNARAGHYGVDIVAAGSNDVKAILDGTVILAEFTIETGYVIAIQHDENLLSIYKHNSELTRKVGNFIEQGEVIAISGNTGENTSGPHLHFELWYDGEALDPAAYINFE